ncbi:Ribose operon repressor [Candidatus Hydrogenisulfobacillus filiaventi]|uniref:Ribose operon repressor n=1 Tax=Candidatus Hydrogenisulfobacillus filiaventi TaxID=2707344 RepID=A0A6F8ZFG6_9FIRM|nr:Ribose operon repressor [Candidatus Hydrogenisulfobacillus filiaventi]
MATIKDVARKAGVGVGTVSRVLNGTGPVSPETRRAVLAAVEALGYMPSTTARAMVTKRTQTVGVLLPDIQNPFFPMVARGVEDACRQAGYTVILLSTDWDRERELSAAALLRRQGADGAVLVSVGDAAGVHAILGARGAPVVVVDRAAPGLAVSQLSVDHYRGEYEAVRWVRSRGHRRVGFLAGPAGVDSAELRLQAFLDAMEWDPADPGLPVARAGYGFEGGQRAAAELLDRFPDLTCLVAANDLSALGALSWLARQGRRVPDDIGVVGFDDILLASLVHPALTTVRQPAYAMGYRAAELLLQALKDPGRGPVQETLRPELVIRDSC